VADILDTYIEAAGASTARARNILAVMLSAALLLICAYANVYAGFRQQRLTRLEAAIDYRNAERAPESENRAHGVRTSTAHPGEREWIYLKRQRPFASDSELELAIRADVRDLRTYQIREGSTVSIPIVNIPIHVGDLWVAACIGFTFLQIALIYATAREIADTRTALRAARDVGYQEHRRAYDLLSSRQLFTIPPGAHLTWESAWRLVPKVLLWLPPGAQIFGIIVGNQYRRRFFPSDSNAGWLAFTPEIIVTLLSAALTVFLVGLETHFDRIWVKYGPPRTAPPKREATYAWGRFE
jgi:hypothetical protein